MAREHARVFRDIPGVSVVGIWNRSRARAESLAMELKITLVCDSISELFERTQADLAVIAVLETAANAVTKQCLAFPWTVLMEKPPGLNLADARDIQDAARKEERRVLVALNRRFLSSTRAVKADIEAQEGERVIQVQDQQDLNALGQYNYPSVILENWMYANSIHLVDFFHFLGRGALSGVNVIRRWNAARPAAVIASIEFESGDAGLYTAVWNGPGPWMVTVSTPARRWELRPLEQAQFQNRDERQLHPVEISEWDKQFKPGFRLQAEHAVKASRGETSDSVTLGEAIGTMELIDRIYHGA
jgi:predicted dehydrogenase